MHREYHEWHSPHLGRKMEMLIFGHAGARVLVFPTRCGRFYEYEEFGMIAALAEKLENGWLQLFCVDSIDTESVYNFSLPPHERILRHIQYEQYILEEVLPLTREKNTQPFMVSHGCSLGAFHAMNIALRHPQHFGRVLALSGRYDLSVPVEDFHGLFDDHYDEDIYFHTPNHYLPNLHEEGLLQLIRRMQIMIVIGDQDPFLGSNLYLSDALHAKDIQHDFLLWNGRAHKAKDWRKMVQLYL